MPIELRVKEPDQPDKMYTIPGELDIGIYMYFYIMHVEYYNGFSAGQECWDHTSLEWIRDTNGDYGLVAEISSEWDYGFNTFRRNPTLYDFLQWPITLSPNMQIYVSGAQLNGENCDAHMNWNGE